MNAVTEQRKVLLEIADLKVHFDIKDGKQWFWQPSKTLKAVDGVTLRLYEGETLGVVGESGCGKSTTARLLMQLLTQDSGELIFDGQGAGSSRLPLKAYRRQVQMVFQDSYASLNPRLTMEESIAFGQRVHGVSAREASEYARYLLAHVGLEPARFADRYPHALSGGQRQRVNIARALAMDPEIVFFDEPSAGLDPVSAALLDELILELKENMGMTVVVVTHDLDSIFTIGNNSVFLDAVTHTMITGGDPHVLRCDQAHPDIVRFLNRGKTDSCPTSSKGYRS